MRTSLLCVALLSTILSPGPAAAEAPALTEVWSLAGFSAPESIAFDAPRKLLYVSNVNGEGGAKDGNGFLSRVSPSGELLERKWIEGLDAPKGLTLRGDTLFVADIDALVEIDVQSGTLTGRHPAAGAKFLNDVVDAGDAGILVSDSANARIYRWHDEQMSVWLEHAELASVNGLLHEGAELIVSTMQGKLLSVDLQSRELKVLAEGLGAGDGIVALGNSRYLVSEWPGRLFHVAADGSHSVLIDSREQKQYINDFLAIDSAKNASADGHRMLLVPSWEPGVVTAYRLQD